MQVGTETAISDRFDAHKAFSQQILSYHDPDHIEKMKSMEGRFPIISLNGTNDPSMPAETLAENMAEYDWIDFRIYEGAGQWLLFDHWKDALGLVERYSR